LLRRKNDKFFDAHPIATLEGKKPNYGNISLHFPLYNKPNRVAKYLLIIILETVASIRSQQFLIIVADRLNT